jgi:hypothetical protein
VPESTLPLVLLPLISLRAIMGERRREIKRVFSDKVPASPHGQALMRYIFSSNLGAATPASGLDMQASK